LAAAHAIASKADPPGSGAQLDLELFSIISGIGQGEFAPSYQPLRSLHTGLIAGVEALARWHRPGFGAVAPADFIPQLERGARASDLTAWMIERTCLDLARWSERFELPDGFVGAVNVSATEFGDDRLVEFVREALGHTSIPAERLCLELTETAQLTDLGRARALMSDLRELGVRLALDDFGAGHMGDAELDALPVDLVKIDMRYVLHVTTDADCRHFVSRTVARAEARDQRVVAEGIEQGEQARILRDLGCAFGQGFGLGRPGPGDAVLAAFTNLRAAALGG